MNTEQKDEQKLNDRKSSELFDDLYRRVEERLKELSDQLKEKVIPQTEEALKKNVFKTLSLGFLAGSVVGILLVVLGTHRGSRK